MKIIARPTPATFPCVLKVARWIILVSFAFGPVVQAQNGLPPASRASAQFDLDQQLANTDFDIPHLEDRPDSDNADPGPDLTIEKIEAVRLEVMDDGSVREAPMEESGFEQIVQSRIAEKGGEFTFASLQELANDLTGHLRAREHLLATVYVPSQRVQDGIVRLEVLMGKLGEVKVEGNESYRSTQIVDVFDKTLGQSVNRREIEESMLLLQDYPGLSIGGTFYPGQQLGETRLQLNVNEEKRFDAIFLGDNYGSDFTGRNRVGAHLEWNNPFKLADKVIFDLVVAEKPSQVQADDSLSDRLFGSLRYEMSPWSARWGAGFEVSSNYYVVGNVGGDDLAQLEITGETEMARLFVMRKSRSRDMRIDYEFGLSVQDAETFAGGDVTARDDLTTLDWSARLQRHDELFGGGVNYLNVKLVQGLDDTLNSMGDGSSLSPGEVPVSRRIQVAPGVIQQADGKFFKAEYHYQRYQPTPLVDVLLTVNGQYTKDPLVAVQQSGIGGPYSVRAYPSSTFLADKTQFYSLEVRKPFFNDRLTLSAFYDHGRGKNIDVLANERSDTVSLSGAGLGARWNIWQQLNMNLSVAWALDDKTNIPIEGNSLGEFGTGSEDLDKPMVWFSLFWRP